MAKQQDNRRPLEHLTSHCCRTVVQRWLSEKLADMRISKSEVGAVRDGYRRGWFKRMYERFSPF